MEKPKDLAREVYAKTGLEISGKGPIAVLTEEDREGRESLLWKRPGKEWIYFAYPEENILPIREGMGTSLKELTGAKFADRFDLIKSRLQDFMDRPEDVESIHQYRVSVRSFRALISMVKPVLPRKTYLEIQEIFRQAGGKAERLRELDVLIEEWDKARNPEDQSLRKDLVLERKKEETRLHEEFSRGNLEKLLDRGYKLLSDGLERARWEDIDGIKVLDGRLKAWHEVILEGRFEMKDFVFPKVHKIRLASKKYRYVAEVFQDSLNEDQKLCGQRAKEGQKVLGKLCDSIRNREAMEELLPYLGPSSGEEARRFIRAEKDRKEKLLKELGFKKEKAS